MMHCENLQQGMVVTAIVAPKMLICAAIFANTSFIPLVKKKRSYYIWAVGRSRLASWSIWDCLGAAVRHGYNDEEGAMPHGPEQAALAEFYEDEKGKGLVDVRFCLRNRRETTTEQACREVNSMHKALIRGHCFKKEFGDSRRI